MPYLIGAFILNVAFLFYNLWYNKRVTKILTFCEGILKEAKDATE